MLVNTNGKPQTPPFVEGPGVWGRQPPGEGVGRDLGPDVGGGFPLLIKKAITTRQNSRTSTNLPVYVRRGLACLALP